MRRLLSSHLSSLLCCLFFAGSLAAQSPSTPPAAAQEQAQEPQQPEEADALPEDPFADTANEQDKSEQTERTNQGEGETAWEQLNAEREPAVSPSREDEPPETFSPLIIWRIIRSLWSKN